VTATLSTETYKNPTFANRTAQPAKTAAENEVLSEKFFKGLMKYAFAGQTDSTAIPAPSCYQQAPFNPIGRSGAPTTYQHTFEQSE
jgi:hypothetical protein